MFRTNIDKPALDYIFLPHMVSQPVPCKTSVISYPTTYFGGCYHQIVTPNYCCVLYSYRRVFQNLFDAYLKSLGLVLTKLDLIQLPYCMRFTSSFHAKCYWKVILTPVLAYIIILSLQMILSYALLKESHSRIYLGYITSVYNQYEKLLALMG